MVDKVLKEATYPQTKCMTHIYLDDQDLCRADRW